MKAKTLRRFYDARPRLVYALVLGVVAAGAIPLPDADLLLHVLVGWNVAVVSYLAFVWTMMIQADDGDVRAYAERQDESTYVVLTTVSLAALLSLAAIVLELATASKGALHHPFHIVLTGVTVVGSWFLIPTIFGIHYAHSYYQTDRGQAPPLLFPEQGLKPDYWDFIYFSFTIAVASQTAEIAPGNRSMRKAVLGQAVLSFFFNASILALSINIGASLASG